MEYAVVLLGAVLLGLLASLPALVQKQHWRIVRGFWKTGLSNCFADLMWSECGAVTVTYFARTASNILNSVTPPTQSQGSGIDTIKAVCVFGTVDDVQALITHNMGLDISAPGYFDPQIFMEPLSSATTSWPLITFDRTNTNVVKANKKAGDTATTILVTIRRPGGPYR